MIYKDIELELAGHSTFIIRYKEIVIYIDPYNIDLNEKADYILITHDHYDHCSPDDIEKVSKEDTLVVASKKASKKLKGNVRPVDVDDKINLGFIRLEVVEAYNTDKPFHPRGEGVGFVIDINGTRIYHAGDTDLIPEMEKLKDIDIALLPVSGTYVMNADEAAEAADIIKPKIAIPMHYGTIVGNRTDAEIFDESCDCKVVILSSKVCKAGECEAKEE